MQKRPGQVHYKQNFTKYRNEKYKNGFFTVLDGNIGYFE